ncbi:Starch-binding associating with outer membrane [Parapedobacter composti]|uniref:Starch-binding associating with outer membrane n=1 Tax=Parapedobacter composti TaxID=623281 RepID=A0A1I1F374_9SPHI|nr:RagB/SusD family nutrient uptake outer membrane protein [Parapedobacter composti]SFB93721.1 Starch-binding associating with outer membrane [Parapedobacter composti]
MKQLFILLSAFLLASCQEFLTRDPENEIGSEEFMRTENDLVLYTNGFLQRHMPDEETLAWGDQYSDNIATRTSTQFLIGDNWGPDEQGGWGGGASGKWSELRNVNYFLDNLPKARSNVSDATYRHYEGVGRFWRAYFYYSMVRTFGDVPWYDSEIDIADADQLYKPRDSREFVMDKILEDLNFAAENCSAEDRYVRSSTLINKWVVLAFKSRVCLFEGTYRNYHEELGLKASAPKFLREAVSAAEELMTTGPYRLVNNPANVATQYRSLFTSENLNTTEVILGLSFRTDVRMHSITWKLFSASFGNNWSLTQPFVNQYLMLDGSRFTDLPGYEQKTYREVFENRDRRLEQTVISPSYTRRISGAVRRDAPNFALTSTGYQPIKWALDDDVHVGLATANNSIPMFRYAEVLLNYAEAKAELGEMDVPEWDRSIRLLRERAGVNGAPPAAYDPYLAAYYQHQTTDKWILEVRRERGVELVFENVRYDDIMRWRMGELLEKTWQGIYIPQKGEVYDLNGDGAPDLSVVDAEPPANQRIPGVAYVVLGSVYRLSEGDRGNLEFGFSQGRRWLDKKYLRPIPTSARQVNPALGQNPGWER